jgi:hypothetical protein
MEKDNWRFLGQLEKASVFYMCTLMDVCTLMDAESSSVGGFIWAREFWMWRLRLDEDRLRGSFVQLKLV